jgi:hypothetical protein
MNQVSKLYQRKICESSTILLHTKYMNQLRIVLSQEIVYESRYSTTSNMEKWISIPAYSVNAIWITRKVYSQIVIWIINEMYSLVKYELKRDKISQSGYESSYYVYSWGDTWVNRQGNIKNRRTNHRTIYIQEEIHELLNKAISN